MKNSLKYIALILMCAIILLVLARLEMCGGKPDKEEVTVVIPQDSSFVPVMRREFRPRSTPFERAVKTHVRLPKGVTEANVARIVTVIKRIPVDTSGNFLIDTTTVIISKLNQLFVPKQDEIDTKVEQVEFIPPILEWDLFLSAGVNISKVVSPAVAISPLKILGKVELPVVLVDTEGVGLGAGWRYKDFIFGALGHRRFENSPAGIKLFVHYSF